MSDSALCEHAIPYNNSGSDGRDTGPESSAHVWCHVSVHQSTSYPLLQNPGEIEKKAQAAAGKAVTQEEFRELNAPFSLKTLATMTSSHLVSIASIPESPVWSLVRAILQFP
ncbi:hypothetical protein MG293_019711 [Ovis ammon polii]|uniref:Uncharacterized protein n=1 Tax=Ovis ammon polii TaxID=230172 RepID=A0AAD4XXN6_OVIAM|nr:hypothetical protein MG293_019711 [Ovis ammon polii]